MGTTLKLLLLILGADLDAGVGAGRVDDAFAPMPVPKASAPPVSVPEGEPAPYQPFTADDTPVRLFRSRCAMCHGAEGKGNGRMMKQGLGARDVTSAAWQDTRSDDQIRASIMDGLPGTRMKAYRANGSEEQFNGMVGLIRSMRAGDAGQP